MLLPILSIYSFLTLVRLVVVLRRRCLVVYEASEEVILLSLISHQHHNYIISLIYNRQFRHIESEMVRDADAPIAVVKWLAEFDNRLINRGNKTYKRVRFCQMAKLIFAGDRICYLEEYAQSMTGPGVRWPGLGKDVSDEELMTRIRQDPIKVDVSKERVECNICRERFPSRTQLFNHLKSTKPNDDESKCLPITDHAEAEDYVWICLSLGYICNDNVGDKILRALMAVADDKSLEERSLHWAVPPNFASSAVVNIASIKSNKKWIRNDVSSVLASLNNRLKGTGICVHTAVIVDRPCVKEKREYEKYETFIPWLSLKNDHVNELQNSTIDIQDPNGWSKESNQCHRALSETAAAPFVDINMVKRLRDGARVLNVLKDASQTDLGEEIPEMKVRVRTRTMDKPWHQLCRISISMRQPRRGIVERIVGILLAYARESSMTDDELIALALQVTSSDKDECNNANDDEEEDDDSICIRSTCLLEPALTKYEGKFGIKLCRGRDDTNSSELDNTMSHSIEQMEILILSNIWRKYAQPGTHYM